MREIFLTVTDIVKIIFQNDSRIKDDLSESDSLENHVYGLIFVKLYLTGNGERKNISKLGIRRPDLP